ncbi:hypothetical protein F5051DRAFT_423569, partial [Lentinula edodes]
MDTGTGSMFYQAKNFAIYGGNFIAVGGDDINKIHKWLNAPDCSANFVTAADNRCSGTCQWIFEVDRYKEWRSNPGILWIQVPAGSGKTFLM